MKRLILFFISVSLISGCASTSSSGPETDWFLRSDFSWWKAYDEYKLRLDKDTGLFSVAFELQADGSSYHFKVADKYWSEGKNCGVPKGQQAKLIIDQWHDVDCFVTTDKILPLSESFELKPNSSQKFLLQVKMSEGAKPLPTQMRLTAL